MALPQRKHPRLKNYDYAQCGCYHLTFCTQNRKPILSRIVPATCACDRAQIDLHHAGQIADHYIRNIPNVYSDVELIKYAIMPNHVHLLILLGPEATVECDGYIWPLAAGESLLLCSDGLVNTVTDQEMLLEVTNGDADTCMDRLLAIAKSRGARDNVTAVLVRKA